MLPNFLIIGAGRSGTTSLHRYLGQHPDVFMSAVKEPSFFRFADGEIPFRGPGTEWLRRTAVTTRAQYEALFAAAGGARAIGEASPGYLIDHAVPARIHAVIPGARLVAILRHPVERAHAAYLGLRRDGLDPAPTFEEALADEDRRLREGWPFAGLARNGFYHRMLVRYYERFPRERIRVHLFEDFVARPGVVLRDVFAFLGVDPSFVPDVSRRHGATGIVKNPVVRALWTRSETARRLVRRFLPLRWRDRAFGWVTSDLVKPPLAPATRAALLDVFREDILALQALIGRDLSSWLR